MKLDASFIRLPHRFDPDAALEQIDQLGAEAWRAHPRGWADHRMVPLVTVDGEDDATRMIGTMKPTAQLDALPAITHLLGALDTVVGRTLLVRAESGAKAERMVDAGAYWHRRVRVFMPLASTARAVWTCAEDQTPIPAGQAWLVNGWGGYGYDNGADEALIYVVVDTIGSASFWNTVRSADRPLEPERADQLAPPDQPARAAADLRYRNGARPPHHAAGRDGKPGRHRHGGSAQQRAGRRPAPAQAGVGA